MSRKILIAAVCLTASMSFAKGVTNNKSPFGNKLDQLSQELSQGVMSAQRQARGKLGSDDKSKKKEAPKPEAKGEVKADERLDTQRAQAKPAEPKR